MQVNILATLFALHTIAGQAQPSDEDLVKATIHDYIDGYYAGDAERVKSALHPKLAKRFLARTKDGKIELHEESAEGFVKLTASGDGPRSYKKEQQRAEITVYEVYRGIASAKLVGADWMDYIQLGRSNGKWQIVNVIWTSYPPVKS